MKHVKLFVNPEKYPILCGASKSVSDQLEHAHYMTY